MLNICLCFDLILTIQSPFTPAASRNKFYYLSSAAIPILLVLVILAVNSNNQEDCNNCLSQYPATDTSVTGTVVKGSGNLVLAITMTSYLIVSTYSGAFALRRLNRPGVSADIRLMFIKKHFLYVIVFIFVWIL
jgi:hypothetical protein